MLYTSFKESTHNVLPISVSDMARFIAFLFQKGYKSSSISSIVAGLGYFHSICSFSNPGAHILIKKLIKGAKNLNGSFDMRLPITVNILQQLVGVIKRTATSTYESYLYSAMFTLAFHALLRIGEYTVSSATSNHTLLMNHVELLYKSSTLDKMLISIPHYKHSLRPVTLSIKANAQSQYCPVILMNKYLKVRKSAKSSILFVSELGIPITSYVFSKVFKTCILDLNLDTSLYKPHSLRIGGASLAHELNYSDSQIAALGRWHSNSYQRYIRVPLIASQLS